MLKSRLANWILVILKVHPLFFYDFSLISKVSINIHGQRYAIICISNHHIKIAMHLSGPIEQIYIHKKMS